MAKVNLKELKYQDQLVLVEMARRTLKAKADADGNVISTTYATKAEVEALKALHIEVVDTLPTTGETNIIYFVPKSGGSAPDAYDEYIWIKKETETTGHYERIGSTDIDLSNYLKLTGGSNQVVQGGLIIQPGGADDIRTELNGNNIKLFNAATHSTTISQSGGSMSDVSITLPSSSGTLALKSEITTVEESDTNGNIKVNGEELTVYTSPITSTDVEIDW